MWQATFQCTSCSTAHVICSNDGSKPRTFAYVCPESSERVTVRFHDPAQVLEDWVRVESCLPEAVAAEDTSSRGTFEL